MKCSSYLRLSATHRALPVDEIAPLRVCRRICLPLLDGINIALFLAVGMVTIFVTPMKSCTVIDGSRRSNVVQRQQTTMTSQTAVPLWMANSSVFTSMR